MGSMITLGLGRLEIDWGKNEMFKNHSALFCKEDIHPAPYYYADDVVESKEAYVKPLRGVVRRLEMMGYTLAKCKSLYQDAVSRLSDWIVGPIPVFETFADVLKKIDIHRVSIPEDGDYDFGEFAACIIKDAEFKKTLDLTMCSKDDAGEFFGNMDPYIILRLLAENPTNLDEPVAWRFADIVGGGYAHMGTLYEGVAEQEKCLIVTEGSSDGMILRESLPIAAPELADFFHFVDMSENYPFTGTGNVYRFCQGLSRIRILNRILVVLDNDVAGREAYKKIRLLDLPSHMRVALLPEIADFKRVQTMGPTGLQEEDINGRAVSIECFLDIWSKKSNRPTVRWTSFNEEIGEYQGNLLKKDEYRRAFHEAIKRNDKTYDFGRLNLLWNHLVGVCV